MWLFINGELAVDIGGVHRRSDATIALDDLVASHALTAGETFTYDLFYAERHTMDSYLRFDLPAVPAPATAGLLILGAGFVGGTRRRRS